MAEKLKRTQPTSSIANALNLEAVRAATGPAQVTARPSVGAQTDDLAAAPRPSVVTFPGSGSSPVPRHVAPAEPKVYAPREPTGEPPSIVRQIQLTPSADATLEKVIGVYSRATGLQLSKSEFVRAVLHALAPTVDLHAREAANIGPLRRPKNEACLFHKRDELERAIARAFTIAMRAAPAMN
jgi:hypothetical protein